ncbi:hypothetical protein LJC07_06075 [Christensenellaceae bacterium OttesenSCG-928-L17]|nr:hypothetical protein [Christensenellaceae bacterium OttesenSCG-928-L17]
MANEENTKKQTPLTKVVVERLKTESTLFRDQKSEPHIAVNHNGTKVLHIRSQEFKEWLRGWAMSNYDEEPMKDRQIDDIANTLSALAIHRGEEKRLDVRLHQPKDAEILVDMGEKAIHITSDRWIIVDDYAPCFRRYKHQRPLVEPKRYGNIEDLRQFANIKNRDDWFVFLVFTVSALIPNFPKPALMLVGDQGSGKTVVSKIWKKLVDPSLFESSALIRDPKELARVASRHALLVFDNTSRITPSMSDDLCRLITHDSLAKRALYTDDEDIIYSSRCHIALNGIDIAMSAADLLDRTLIIRVERITDDKRMTEVELNEAFERLAPSILGGMLDIVVKALKIYPTVKLDWLPRMADFAKFGYAIGEAMDGYSGDEFMEAYKRVIERQVDEALMASPVAQAAQYLVRDIPEWTGTASAFQHKFSFYQDYDLGEDVASLCHHKIMRPENVALLGKELTRAKSTLKSLGIELYRYRENNERLIKLVNTKYKNKPSEETAKTEDTGKSEELDFDDIPF